MAKSQNIFGFYIHVTTHDVAIPIIYFLEQLRIMPKIDRVKIEVRKVKLIIKESLQKMM